MNLKGILFRHSLCYCLLRDKNSFFLPFFRLLAAKKYIETACFNANRRGRGPSALQNRALKLVIDVKATHL